MSNLPDFEAWAVFATVSRIGTFSGAAERLNLSQATVSKIITRLEKRTQTTLFHRTSRQLSLTESGKAMLKHAQELLNRGKNIEAEIKELSTSYRGPIRISAPMYFGINFLAKLLPNFLFNYPEIELDIQFDDKKVDLIEEAFDIALRITNLEDSTFIARRLKAIRLLLVGSPNYFKKYGKPQRPEELINHKILHYSYGKTGLSWHFQNKEEKEIIQALPKPIYQSNNAESFHYLLKEGIGIALQPEFYLDQALKDKTLITVMEDWQVRPVMLNIVTPPGRLRPARVQLFMDYLAKNLTL